MKSADSRRSKPKPFLRLTTALFTCICGAACFITGTEPVDSPLVALANLLYLEGAWVWSDSMVYSRYIPNGEGVPHHGFYIVSGTASIEPIDSVDIETYELTAVANVEHVDSTASSEIERWELTEIEYVDTVYVENDTIFGLSVEPIPPDAAATTNSIRWVFRSGQLWCTNWLTDTIRAGNRDNCSTTVTWTRADSSDTSDTTSAGI